MKKIILVMLMVITNLVIAENNWFGIGAGLNIQFTGGEFGEFYNKVGLSPYLRLDIRGAALNRYGPLKNITLFGEYGTYSSSTEREYEFRGVKWTEEYKAYRAIICAGVGFDFQFKRIKYQPYVGIIFLNYKEDGVDEEYKVSETGMIAGLHIQKFFSSSYSSALILDFSYGYSAIDTGISTMNPLGFRIGVGFKLFINPFQSKFEE